MLEADRRVNLYIKYQGYFILKGITLRSWRDSYPIGSAETCRSKIGLPPVLHQYRLTDFDGDFKDVCCIVLV